METDVGRQVVWQTHAGNMLEDAHASSSPAEIHSELPRFSAKAGDVTYMRLSGT